MKINLLISFLLLMIACGTTRPSRENISNMFDPSASLLNPEFTIYHFSADSSEIYYRFPAGNLLFRNENENFTANYILRFAVYKDYDDTTPSDTISFTYTLISETSENIVEGSLNIFLRDSSAGLLRITVLDNNRNNESVRYLNYDKLNKYGRQYFLLKDTASNVIFRNYTQNGETVHVNYSGRTDKFWIRCYFRKFPIASPPFKMDDPDIFEYAADSIYYAPSENFKITPARYGFYHIQADTLQKSGLTIFNFEDDHPKLTQSVQLIEPVRYLTTRKEYSEMTQAADKKKAADRFWLNLAGSEERARNLIRSYYRRVEYCNYTFTSFTEGWKTDRGMIYIIFGKPHSVYREGNNEHWNYTSVTAMTDLTFTFRKLNNPFTDNDYVLLRHPQYENSWYLAVDQWRQGRVLNDY